MAQLTAFNVPDLVAANLQDPTKQEINDWCDGLNTVIAVLDNIINFMGMTTPIIPNYPHVAAGANQAVRLTHADALRIRRTQVILFQGQVMNEGRAFRPRGNIKVQRPAFSGEPEQARGFHAAIATYRHLRPGDFLDDKTFIAWVLGCMEGPKVNPWRNALMNRRATLLAAGQPLPPLFVNWADFLAEFEAKFLNPNEIENAGQALMALKQYKSAREFTHEFDRLAELAGVTGENFLLDQFRRALKSSVQEKLLRQNFATLQNLQAAAIKWDDALFQFRKQQKTTNQHKKPPTPSKTQGNPTNGTPMDIDYVKLSKEESERRKKAGLCFCCGKGGHIGRNCPDKNKTQASGSKPQGGGSKIAAMERSMSTIDEETVIGESPGKDFQDD